MRCSAVSGIFFVVLTLCQCRVLTIAASGLIEESAAHAAEDQSSDVNNCTTRTARYENVPHPTGGNISCAKLCPPMKNSERNRIFCGDNCKDYYRCIVLPIVDQCSSHLLANLVCAALCMNSTEPAVNDRSEYHRCYVVCPAVASCLNEHGFWSQHKTLTIGRDVGLDASSDYVVVTAAVSVSPDAITENSNPQTDNGSTQHYVAVVIVVLIAAVLVVAVVIVVIVKFSLWSVVKRRLSNQGQVPYPDVRADDTANVQTVSPQAQPDSSSQLLKSSDTSTSSKAPGVNDDENEAGSAADSLLANAGEVLDRSHDGDVSLHSTTSHNETPLKVHDNLTVNGKPVEQVQMEPYDKPSHTVAYSSGTDDIRFLRQP